MKRSTTAVKDYVRLVKRVESDLDDFLHKIDEVTPFIRSDEAVFLAGFMCMVIGNYLEVLSCISNEFESNLKKEKE